MAHSETDGHWEGPGLDAWRPWRPDELALQLAGVAAPWCVVGGWAIDLWLGRTTRHHEDIEAALPRTSFPTLTAHLADFKLHVVGDGEVRALDGDVPADRHQVWVLDPRAGHWRTDLMLEPGDAETWVFRRDERIRSPRAQMVGMRDGIPYLLPHGVLLFKAKAARAKDEADFAACLPHLDPRAGAWLLEALRVAHPGHPWIERLAFCDGNRGQKLRR